MNQYTEHTAAIAAPPHRRRRPALSCVQCRRRKIRCDQKKPCCNQCERSKGVTCVYKSEFSNNAVLSTPNILGTITGPTSSIPDIAKIPSQTSISDQFTSTLASLQNGWDENSKPSKFKDSDNGVRLPDSQALDLRPLHDELPQGTIWPHLRFSSEVERQVVPATSIFHGHQKERPSAFKMKLVGETHWMNLVSQVSHHVSTIVRQTDI